jgi:hypothetical protein
MANNYTTYRVTAIESEGKPEYFAIVQRDMRNLDHVRNLACDIADLMLADGYVEVKITRLYRKHNT